jgi:pyruvate dehydrogenase E2 component (dihydrolipoamide acetyltransferase)
MAKIIEMPKLGFDMAEGTLMQWLKAEGEKIEKGDMLADIETDKATVQVDSSVGGIVFKHLVEENTTVPIGNPIAVIADEGEDVNLDELLAEQAPLEKQIEAQETAASEATIPETVPEAEPAAPETGTSGFIKASPVAKAMARDKKIELGSINGSGPGGRIVKRDVEAALKQKPPTSAPVPSPKAKIVPGQDQRIPVNRLRAAIGKRMQASNQNVPVFFITRSYDAADLLKVRRQINDEGVPEKKLSVNDFIVRAVALALRQYPNLNASLEGDEIIQHGDINIGNAVSLENGLLTVVVKNADQKSLQQISQETSELAQRARGGKLRNEDVEGSTFTISNLGMYAVDDFVAIINPPEAAILAIGRAQEVPVIENGMVKTGWRMNATLSADHRITDGAEAAQFMQQLGLYLEQPWRLM